MKSPKPHLILRVLSFVLFILATQQISAQCNPPDQLPSLTCDEAPLVCLENACYETLNIPLFCCDGWCGPNTAIHNPQYFQFIPTSPDIEIDIHVDGCSSGVGLQSALLDACPWDNSNVIDCDPGTPPGGTMVLTATGLIVGQVYWLVIDGSSGATCDYTITFTEGIFSPGFNGQEIQSAMASPESVCQGYNALQFIADPPISGAHGYWWILGWSGDTVTTTLPFAVIDVPNDVDPGTYEICVKAYSGCDTTENDVCFDVEIYEIPPEDKDPATYCPEEFPIYWGPLEIEEPGEYHRTFTDVDGCVFDSIWMVEEYPEVEVGELEVVYCLPEGEDTYTYEGEVYYDAGMYDLFYPNQGLNGCDSMATLDLTLIGIDVEIELTCENGEFVLTPYTQNLVPANADLEYFWYEGTAPGGPPIFDNTPFLTLQDGCYTLCIKVIVPNGDCEFCFEPFCFDDADYKPDPPVLANGDTAVCAQEGVFFHVIVDPFNEPYEYTWSGPGDAPLFQDGGPIAEFDFSNSDGGQVCVYATGECGDGPPTCFNVDLIETPVADFTYTPEVCVDQGNTITFTGSASTSATLVWDFGSPTSVTGTNPGPFVVTWSIPGNKVVTLTVIEPGCDTAYNSAIITVDQLTPPTINCTSTISSILFDWDDVAGSSGYEISLNGGAFFPVPGSQYLDSPLSPGTNVTMILNVISGGPCPNIVDTMTCIAQNCPPPTIVLSGEDSACLNNPTLIDLDAIVNGNPGTGSWTGPGIIDATNGIFDPKAAGAGQHQLTYTVDVNGCPFNEPYMITVFDSIIANFTLDPVICITDVANLSYTGNASGAAQYNYDFGTANVVAGSGAGPYQLDWNTPGSKTVRLFIQENGCTSETVTHTTDVKSTLNGPVVNCSPNTSTVELSWTGDANAIAFDTIVLTGQNGSVVGTDYVFGGLVPGDTIRIQLTTFSPGPCPDRIDTFECVARNCPMPLINVKPVADICLYPGTGSVDLDVTVTNGNGVGDWSGPGVTDLVNGRFDPNIAGAGAHVITFHYLDDGCDFNNSITINVYDVPDAFISNSDLQITCTSSSLFLDGTSSTGSNLSYLWTASNGGNILSGANTATAEAGDAGDYQLLVVDGVSGCRDSTKVTVTKDSNIPTADPGPNRTVTCDSTQFTLGGPLTTTGVNVIYNWTTSGGNIVGGTTGKQVLANKNGSYTLTVRDTVTGCQSAGAVMIGIDTVVASILLTPGDTIDCNTAVSTATSSLNEPVSDYTFLWTTSDGLIDGNATNPDVNVTQGGTYTLTIHNKRNGCEKSARVVVPESDEIIDDVDVTVVNIKCFGDNNGALMINNVSGGSAPFTYSWSVSPQGGTSISSLAPGQYGLTVSDQNGCSFTKTFSLAQPQQVTLDLGPNLTVAGGDSVTIDISTNVTPGAISSIQWSGYDGLFCPGCPSFQFIASTSATISASIADTSGCTAEDSMRLTVIIPRIIYIPNLFSPNGDNKNDYFTIYGRFNLININSMNIYDRWGNQVFSKKDMTPGVEDEGWDGSFDGEPMQPGVYVFVAELQYEDITETVTGSITLMR